MLSKTELISELIATEKTDPTKIITAPGDTYPLLAKYTKEKVEVFLCVTLNGAHNVIKVHKICIGLLNRVLIHPREIFIAAIKDRASAIIIAHNHPSGNLDPSQEDKEVCKRMVDAGKIIGIEVLDCLIITQNGYYSFLEEGLF